MEGPPPEPFRLGAYVRVRPSTDLGALANFIDSGETYIVYGLEGDEVWIGPPGATKQDLDEFSPAGARHILASGDAIVPRYRRVIPVPKDILITTRPS